MGKLSDSSRKEFEEFMAERFEKSIDRRRCKNGDGNDYMSWDMNVARAVWQHLSQRAEAAEARSKVLADDLLIERTLHSETLEREDVLKAKLAELEKQEPVSSTTKAQLDIIADGGVGSIFGAKDMPVKLFTRRAPAINLAELVPDERSYKDVNCDLTDFGKAISAQGWNDCRAAILANLEGIDDNSASN